MNATTNASQWTEVGYFYEPIAYYDGKVLKCAGIACEMNMKHMMEKPGMVLLDGYKGDRITSETHEPFTAL